METIFSLLPIVGSINDREITIVCETFADRSFTLNLSSMLSPSIEFEIDVATRAKQVEKISLENIDPGHYYLQWKIGGKTVHTQSLNVRLNPRYLVFASGDIQTEDARRQLWPSIATEMPDIIVHLGDNIYANEEFKQLQAWLEESSPSREELERMAVYLYSNLYESAWNRWARIIGGHCNLFGLGDHDIGGDLQSSWSTLDDKGRSLVKVAFDCYDRYQSALTSNVISYEDGRGWLKRWNLDGKSVSMAFLDRPFSSGDFARLEIVDMVHPDTDFLIVATAVPPLSTPLIDRLTLIHRDGPLDESSIFSFLEKVRFWIEGKEGRQAVVVSGGSLFGATGHIQHKKWKSKDERFRFAFTAPACNNVVASAYLNMSVFRLGGYYHDEYTYRFEETMFRRNYITLDLSENGMKPRLRSNEETRLPSPQNIGSYVSKNLKSGVSSLHLGVSQVDPRRLFRKSSSNVDLIKT